MTMYRKVLSSKVADRRRLPEEDDEGSCLPTQVDELRDGMCKVCSEICKPDAVKVAITSWEKERDELIVGWQAKIDEMGRRRLEAEQSRRRLGESQQQMYNELMEKYRRLEEKVEQLVN